MTLDQLNFDNSFTRDIPADPEMGNFRRQVPASCFSRVSPRRAARPELVSWSREMANTLGLSEEYCRSGDFLQVFSGNRLLPAMDPYAACYGGHQFGSWAGPLGDGRVINLGEVVNRKGERWTIQLKGAGPTPYSRMADGLAVLRSSIREFLCSEAMFHLGVPTTRALSLIATGEEVVRDIFYNGNPKKEPGAIVCRVAPSFIRFGNFQILAFREEFDLLRTLADYTIRTDFPHLGAAGPETYIAWFEEVCERTARMVIEWMRVGFVHGVMNTDNMSILGLTIDYGPYGWFENFDPDWTPNTTDAAGKRYRYGYQPKIAQWNLLQLAYAIYPLIGQTGPLEKALNRFPEYYETGWREMMARKLGLKAFRPGVDETFVNNLLVISQKVESDMTIFFRNLARFSADGGSEDGLPSEKELSPLLEACYLPDQLTEEYKQELREWLQHYRSRLREEGLPHETRRAAMNRVNPKYVLRNYLAQLAIDKAEAGDHSMVSELLDVLRRPYDDQPGKEAFAEKRPDWARSRAGCSMLSCSS